MDPLPPLALAPLGEPGAADLAPPPPVIPMPNGAGLAHDAVFAGTTLLEAPMPLVAEKARSIVQTVRSQGYIPLTQRFGIFKAYPFNGAAQLARAERYAGRDPVSPACYSEKGNALTMSSDTWRRICLYRERSEENGRNIWDFLFVIAHYPTFD